METKPELSSHHRWTTGQKIAFRFFFLFLTLQIFTENFLGNLFGGTLFIWRLGEKIFVRPCLWLNDHIFHFKYIPQSWTTFSGSLHTIRDTVYLLLAFLVGGLWTIVDRKRANYNKLFYWFSRFLVVALSCIVFAYGIIKVFPVQMSPPSRMGLYTPVGDLSPFNLLWTTFGYGRPYQIFTGFFEALGAILVLFNRTRVAGLLFIIAVMINVIMLNYTYQIGVLVMSAYILLIAFFLLAPGLKQLVRFFLIQQPAVLQQNEYVPGKNVATILLKTLALLFIGTSFTLNILFAYNRYTKTENINRSREYSLVKNYIVNSDTLKLIENDTLCWRFWSERVADGKRFVTIATMKPGLYKTYAIERDTLKRTLSLHPFSGNDTASLNFSYRDINKINWCLSGTSGQKNIKVELERINPDTIMNLLKTKRTIIVFDDESDSE
ncbi:MAG: hypothetical protein Q8941_04450 [Bacteroidota bacterium]|nr:hypothetical protein [Bacteroidota bacterium]